MAACACYSSGVNSLNRRACNALLHRQAIPALLALIINDHFLKPLLPSWLTGKLNDFAGQFLSPFLLIVLLAPFARAARGQVWPPKGALIASALWFELSETHLLAHGRMEILVGSLRGRSVEMVRDPSDLIALAMAGVALFAGVVWLVLWHRELHHARMAEPTAQHRVD